VTKENGRDAKRSDFKKGDDVVLMTTYENDKYTLRAMLTPEVAAAMRQKLGEKMRQRGNTGQDGQGQRGMGGNGQNGQRGTGGNGQNGQGGMRNRQLPALLSATIESVKGSTVKLTLTGVYKPSQGKELTIEPMQEKKTVEVTINDRTRFFVNGKKAQLSDFKRGEVVAVLIPRRGEKDSEAVLTLMADKDSVSKLRDMLREKMQERRNNRQQQQ
jgi:Cu/Ag efflux protein CusF